jgi:hypothetical protein
VPFDYGAPGAVEALVWNALDEMYAGAPILDRQVAGAMIMRRVADFPGNPADMQQPLFRAFMEARSNYSWFYGGAIEADWMKNLPENERYWKDTPEFFKKLGQWTGWSPVKIEYVVRNGFARQLDETARLVDRIEKGQPIASEGADVPFVGRLFVKDPVGWGSASVQKAAELDKKYEAVKKRIQNVFGPDVDLSGSAIWAQWSQCEVIHQSMGMVDRLNKLNGRLQEYGLTSEQKDLQREMVKIAQRALSAADGFEEDLAAAKQFAEEQEKRVEKVRGGE